MPRRIMGETGYYHVTTRTAGQIALFESDADREVYLRLMRKTSAETGMRIIAWVLMSDHVHYVLDCGEKADALSRFMHNVDRGYARYFNDRTGRVGHLFQGNYWSKPIADDSQLIATVHYVHMNPEVAGIAPMREYRWSSYQEYAGKHWVVDTDTILSIFGSFEAFDSYVGSPDDVVRQTAHVRFSDEDVLALAMKHAGCSSSADLRACSGDDRIRVVRMLGNEGVSARQIARTLGIGASSAARILRS